MKKTEYRPETATQPSRASQWAAESRRLANAPRFILVLGCSLALEFWASGCATRPLRGGRAASVHRASGGLDQSIVQGENASLPSRQSQETIKTRTYTLPAGTHFERAIVPITPLLQHSITPCLGFSNAAPDSAVLSASMAVIEREETRAQTELGAAQKDSAREFAAKLSSLRGIVWLGVAVLMFGLGSLVWPPLKAIIGSVTTSVALIVGGLALMVLPTLIVGNELLILGGVALAVTAWFLAHRHGQLRGQLSANAFNLNPNRNLSSPQPSAGGPSPED